MSSTNGIAHILRGDRKSWCGRFLIMEFYLEDRAHAENCIKAGTRIRPCRRCLRAARASQPQPAESR